MGATGLHPSGTHQPAAYYQLYKPPPGQKPWQCSAVPHASYRLFGGGAVFLQPRGRGLSSLIRSKSLGIFQTRTRWTLKPVRNNGPVPFLSTSSVPPPTVGHTTRCVLWLPFLHLNGILRPTLRLSLLLFRSVGPSIYPLKLSPPAH